MRKLVLLAEGQSEKELDLTGDLNALKDAAFTIKVGYLSLCWQLHYVVISMPTWLYYSLCWQLHYVVSMPTFIKSVGP